jgi:hypothetical protein
VIGRLATGGAADGAGERVTGVVSDEALPLVEFKLFVSERVFVCCNPIGAVGTGAGRRGGAVVGLLGNGGVRFGGEIGAEVGAATRGGIGAAAAGGGLNLAIGLVGFEGIATSQERNITFQNKTEEETHL